MNSITIKPVSLSVLNKTIINNRNPPSSQRRQDGGIYFENKTTLRLFLSWLDFVCRIVTDIPTV